jgi:SM-20-related protein
MIGARSAEAPAQREFLPPYRVLPNFLADTDVTAILAHAEARQAEFVATQVGGDQNPRLDPTFRISTALRGLAAFRPLLTSRIFDRAEALMAGLGMSPATPSRLELQLVAHGDGAFYRPHIDTRTGGGADDVRVLSGVYYFHRQPKGFSGGELRLFNLADPSRFIDIEPTHNTLLIFPSWAPHEVRPVSCPSGEFMDSRFAINAWVYMPRAGAPGKSNDAVQSEATKA